MASREPTLQPPSFFETTPPLQPGSAAALEPKPTPSTPPTLLPSSPSPPPAVPAMLATDLLQVEAQLQSRVGLLERERKELREQLVRYEQNLLQAREQHQTQVSDIRAQSERATDLLREESERVRGELEHALQEREERVRELEAEAQERETQHASTSDELRGRVAQLEETNAALELEVEREKRAREEEVRVLSSQLSEQEREGGEEKRELREQISALQLSLEGRRQRVDRLESYLGGELPGEGEGVTTWREEREELKKTIECHERDQHRLQSESKLLHIRLSSLSEILSLQETELAKSTCGSGPPATLKSLLTRWREKVFALLVQDKMKQIQLERDRKEAERRENDILDHNSQLTREKDILTHALADKSAELQLQINETNDGLDRLDEAQTRLEHLQHRLVDQQMTSRHVVTCVGGVAATWGEVKAMIAATLSRLANHEQRLATASRRMNSLRACITCQLAVQEKHTRLGRTFADAECQSDPAEGAPNGLHLTSYSREQLVQEVATLTRERDSLARRLADSTSTFQEQIRSTEESLASRLSVMEERVKRLQGEKAALADQRSEISTAHSSAEEDRQRLREREQQLEKELRDMQATLQTRIEGAVIEEQQRSRNDLSEMERLLEVARREHAKAVVQLQQLQRQGARERDRAVQAVEMGRARVEQELEATRRKLQSMQAERNLLMTTLRQEGLALPSRRPPPRTTHSRQPKEGSGTDSSADESLLPLSPRSERTTSGSPEPVDSTHSASESPLRPSSPVSARMTDSEVMASRAGAEEDGEWVSPVGLNGDQPVPHPQPQTLLAHPSQPSNPAPQEDIQDVLKDLRLLSTSLLEMQPPVAT